MLRNCSIFTCPNFWRGGEILDDAALLLFCLSSSYIVMFFIWSYYCSSRSCRIASFRVIQIKRWEQLQLLAHTWQLFSLVFLLLVKCLSRGWWTSPLSIKKQLGQGLPAPLTSHQGSRSSTGSLQDLWSLESLLQKQCLRQMTTSLCQDCLLIWEVTYH